MFPITRNRFYHESGGPDDILVRSFSIQIVNALKVLVIKRHLNEKGDIILDWDFFFP
jgi:hypothetical protein